MTSAEEPAGRTMPLLDGELWWGGAVADGTAMPFGVGSRHHRDLSTNAGFVGDPAAGANQSAPLLVSSRGRYVWSAQAFAFGFADGQLAVSGTDVVVGEGDTPTLAGAFRAARVNFPALGRAPAAPLFAGPQYNTWMELPYRPTQDGVLAYVRGLLDAGFPPGVVMIDDRWSVDYGVWRFDPAAFPDPSGMISTLHDWGCPVMLWVVPFISPDSATFRDLAGRGLLIRRPHGEIAVRQWWNGYSAMLDLTTPDAIAWFTGELDELRERYGVDGFKFDAGDLRDYRLDDVTAKSATPTELCEAWARVGLRYPFNEYRAGWKMGGSPLAQRLHDKPPTWDGHGLASLIPESIAQGLIGHPFVCPDMIGGGDLAAAAAGVDQELFVRYAQLAALHPMMQFSLAPHRVLDADHLMAVRQAVDLRQTLLAELTAMVHDAARTGEPILRSLAYDDPDDPGTTDQYTLGGDILVAPVLEPGATTRRVRFPAGCWVAPDGARFDGPDVRSIPVTLTSVPWYRRA